MAASYGGNSWGVGASSKGNFTLWEKTRLVAEPNDGRTKGWQDTRVAEPMAVEPKGSRTQVWQNKRVTEPKCVGAQTHQLIYPMHL